MIVRLTCWLLLVVGLQGLSALSAATPELEITLAHGTPAEAATRAQLQHLLKEYDLSSWIWTRTVVIDGNAVPRSHPVLTLHTRHLKEDRLLLSTFIHEQYHWYAAMHPQAVAAAIKDLKTMYAELLVGGRDGARDEESSYLHLVICYAEYQKLKELIGSQPARQVMEFWATDHYRAIYQTVLDDEEGVGNVVQQHKLFPPL